MRVFEPSATAIDETDEIGYGLYRWAYYTRSKIAAERLAVEAHRSGELEVTVIRPAWIYGPRDRITIARLYRMVSSGQAKIVGRGDNRLNVIYAGNIAEAAITAAERSEAAGEIFNCSNDGEITQQEYFNLLAKASNVPPVALGQFMLGHRGQEACRRPSLLVGPLGELRPHLLDRRQTQFVEQQSEFRGVDGVVHARSPVMPASSRAS